MNTPSDVLAGLGTLVRFGENTILVNELVALDTIHPMDAPFELLEDLKDQARIESSVMTVGVFQDKKDNNDELVILVACAQTDAHSHNGLIHVTSSSPELRVYHSRFPDNNEQLPRTENKEGDGTSMPWQWDSQWSTFDSIQKEPQIMLRVSLITLPQQSEKMHTKQSMKVCLGIQHIPTGVFSLQLLHGGDTRKIELASTKEDILSKPLCVTVSFPQMEANSQVLSKL